MEKFTGLTFKSKRLNYLFLEDTSEIHCSRRHKTTLHKHCRPRARPFNVKLWKFAENFVVFGLVFFIPDLTAKSRCFFIYFKIEQQLTMQFIGTFFFENRYLRLRKCFFKDCLPDIDLVVIALSWYWLDCRANENCFYL